MKREEQKCPPPCHGRLENVFPLGRDGLRHTPPGCFNCSHKTECLRTALQGKEGLKVREEHIDRAYTSGVIGFFERWLKKKDIQRRKKTFV